MAAKNIAPATLLNNPCFITKLIKPLDWLTFVTVIDFVLYRYLIRKLYNLDIRNRSRMNQLAHDAEAYVIIYSHKCLIMIRVIGMCST